MSHRYSIDDPVSLEDLAGDTGPVTQEDRELLLGKEDDEDKKALPPSALKKSKKAKKKVKFGGEYHRVSDAAARPVTSPHKRPEPIFAYNDDDDSDSDIEIDLEAKPGRRHLRDKAFRRRLHFFLFLILLLGGLLFFANVFQSDKEDGKRDHAVTNKKVMSNGTHDYHPTTILISLDGFHPHYVDSKITPNLHDLFTTQSGVPYMTPSFPSSTFPNHWTLVTGMYPANHGIVGNTFFDISEERQFVNKKPEKSLQTFWWGGEPVWSTLAKQNIGTAIHMWPGSEAKWKIDKPMEVDKYNGTERLDRKCERIMTWLDKPIEDRPELIMSYVPTIDQVGHKYGIKGEDLKEALTKVDNLVGSIRHGIQVRSLDKLVNVMIVSDHGMAPTSNDRLVFMEDLVDASKMEHIDGWPLVGLRPEKSVKISQLHKDLKNKEPKDGSWKVYLADEFPPEWHFGSDYKYSSRIAPIWLVPAVGWSITTRDDLEKKMGGTYKPAGVHGYNNTEVLMRALFLAEGPYFKQKIYEPIPNVDIYNIVCDTLNAQPAKNDGKNAQDALRPLDNWHDKANYPDVEFHAEIMKINSTYDILFDSREDADKSDKHGSWREWFDDWRDNAAHALDNFEDWVDEKIDDFNDS